MAFDVFHLLDDPFFTTPRDDKPVFWAGCKQYRSEVENILNISLMTLPSRIILNRGEWGMGKTHAMRFFTNKENLKILCKKIKRKEPLALNLILPRKDVFNSLYIDIINGIEFDRIVGAVKRIQTAVAAKKGQHVVVQEGDLISELTSITGNDRLAKILSALIQGKRDIVERYLMMNAKSKDLEELKVPVGIRTTTDVLKTLKGIFSLFTTSNPNVDSEYSRIIIWIDQVENVADLSGKDIVEIQEFLRDIMDIVPANLVLFLNYSLRPDQKLEDYLSYLGDAVIMRIYKILPIPQMNETEALEYIREAMNDNSNRSAEDKELCKDNLYFPFDERSVKYVLGRIKDTRKYLAPRWINDFLSGLLHMAIEDQKLTAKLKSMEVVIDDKFIKENEKNIIAATILQSRT